MSETVLVEHMPESLRASHEAAGNRGVYPHNGALRLRVSQGCADDVADDWTREVALLEYSYTPLDVGFDLRRHPELAIKLPAGGQLRVRYMTGDGSESERVVEGSRLEVARVLRSAGYRVDAVEGEAS
jgi:hypothetical protein